MEGKQAHSQEEDERLINITMLGSKILLLVPLTAQRRYSSIFEKVMISEKGLECLT